MRHLLLLLVPALAFGQASPSTCNMKMQTGGPLAFACAISITAPGAWTATEGNGLRPVNAAGTTTLSGTGAATVWIRMLGGDWENKAVGEYTDTTSITIAGQAITVNVSVVAKPTFSVTNYGGDPASSFGSGQTSRWLFRDQGTTTSNGRPGGTFDFPASLGGTYTDAVFGTPNIRRVTPDASTILYTSLSLIDTTNTYVIVGDGSAKGIYALDGSGLVYNHPSSTICQFSRTVATRLYCIDTISPNVRQYHFGTPPALVDDGNIWSEPGGKNISHGNTNFVQQDDWIAFENSDGTTLYAVDLANPSTSKSLDLTGVSPAIDGTIAGGQRDYWFGPFKDSNTNRRYIYLGIDLSGQTYDAARQFYFDPSDTNITYRGMGPARTETATSSNSSTCDTTTTNGHWNCVQGGHSTVVWAGGKPHLVTGFDSEGNGGVTSVPFTALYDLTAALTDQGLTKQQSGGLTLASNLPTYFAGATNAPYVAATSSSDPVKTGYTITAATGSSPITITLSPDPGWSGGQSILCSGAVGKTGMDGVLTIAASLGSAQYTISASSTGTYTANSSVCITNSATGLDVQEIQMIRLDSLGDVIQLDRQVQHRSIVNTVNSYGGYARLSVSPDASIVCFNSNGGYPISKEATYCYSNWMTADADEELSVNGYPVTITPNATGASIAATVPTTNDLTVTIYSDRQRTVSVTSTTLSGPGGSRSGSVSGLTTGETYYWRATANGAGGGTQYVAVGNFVAADSTATKTLGGGITLGGGVTF